MFGNDSWRKGNYAITAHTRAYKDQKKTNKRNFTISVTEIALSQYLHILTQLLNKVIAREMRKNCGCFKNLYYKSKITKNYEEITPLKIH